MVQTAPSYHEALLGQWETGASSDVPLYQRKKSTGGRNGKQGQWRINLTPSPPFEVLDWGGGMDWWFVPAGKSVLGQGPYLFSFEIGLTYWCKQGWGFRRRTCKRWQWQQPRCLRPFPHFNWFFVFHSLDEIIFIWLRGTFLSPNAVPYPPIKLFPVDFLQPWRAWQRNPAPLS